MLMRAGEPPAPVTLPLLCALGRHKTDGLARWNAGYYFARCTRCRRDLVRTAFTRWQIPRGFRVVWQGDGAQAHSSDFHRQAGPFGQVEFPIREDLLNATGAFTTPDPETETPGPQLAARAEGEPAADHVDAGTDGAGAEPEGDVAEEADERTRSWFDHDQNYDDDVRFNADDRLGDYIPPEAEVLPVSSGDTVEDDPVAGLSEPEPEPEPEPELHQPPPVSSKYPVVPDFMDEGPDGVGWVVVSGHIVPQAGLVEPGSDAPSRAQRDVPPGLLSQSWQELVRKHAQNAGEHGREWLRKRVRPMQREREVVPEPVSPEPMLPEPVLPEPGLPTQVDRGPTVIEPNPPAPVVPTSTAASDTIVPDPAVPIEITRPRITVADGAHGADVPTTEKAPTPSRVETTGGRTDTLLQYSPLLAAVVFGALVFAAAMVDNRNSPERIVYRDAPVPAATRAPAPVTRPGAARWTPVRSDIAYATPFLLNCRATPNNEAETVRRLSRGAVLRVLGGSPGWVSVVHQGQQCWVSSELVSSTKPV